MPYRTRSHELEDESRRAFASQLPTAWTVQDLTPDYGLDQRVEIFDGDGHVTGLVFYVQLKSTDAPDNTRNRQIRVRADHYNYWHSLSDPVLLALYFSQSGVTYVRWAHRFHPGFRPKGQHSERFTIKLTKSDRWHKANTGWVVEELTNLREVAHGAVHFPFEVGISESPDSPLKGSSLINVLAELKRATSRSDLRWHIGNDRSDIFHLYVGGKQVMARAGKVIYSLTNQEAGNFPDEFPKIDAALCCFGLAVAMAGASSAGMQLISRYGTASGVLFGLWGTHVIHVAAMRSRQFGLAMDLVETWLAEEKATEAALALYGGLRVLSVTRGLSAMERRRLDELGRHDSLRLFSDDFARDVQLKTAIKSGEYGHLKESVQLFEHIFTDSGERLAVPVDTIVRASRWAVELGEYELAEEWLRGIGDHQLDTGEILLFVKSLIMQGRYLEALINLHLTADEHERRGCILLTGLLLSMILIVVGSGQQDRNPSEVLAIKQSLADGASSEELWRVFLEAAKYDAASAVTWSLIHFIDIRDTVDKSSAHVIVEDEIAKYKEFTSVFGIIGNPVLAEGDAEWWAITCCGLFRQGYLRGLFHAIDFALDACSESFHEILRKGYPDPKMTAIISHFAAAVERARQENGYIQFREAPEHLDRLKKDQPVYKFSYVIEQVTDKGVEEKLLLGVSYPLEDDLLYLNWRTIATNVLNEISTQSDADDADRD